MKVKIRPLTEQDNRQMEQLIRACLVEFGANHEGTAWEDPLLGRLSQAYSSAGSRYWVLEGSDGRILGGVGIGPLQGGVCELQKLYCLPEIRGTGLAYRLLETALEYAARFYESVYLETMPEMIAAQSFYEKHGFRRISHRIGATGHFACDLCYIKDLIPKNR